MTIEQIRVTNLEELYAALAQATGGETIVLAAGDYGNFQLTPKSGFDYSYSSEVTIKSEGSDDPAVFQGLDLRLAENITFSNVVFNYTYSAEDDIFYRPFSIADSKNIIITNSVFDGDVASGRSATDDGYGFGIGLSVRGSSEIQLQNNEFFDFYKALAVSQSHDLVVSANEIHSIRMDGMNFAEVANVVIENNYIHDFIRSYESADHADMIQFWTNGTATPSRDIIIRNNTLDMGSGGYTQSIFMRNDLVDRGLAGEEMFYQNVTIEGNTIYNGHLHGITVGETNGLVIINNAVLQAAHEYIYGDPLASITVPSINVKSASTAVAIENNVTGGLTGLAGQSDWTFGSNVFVQNQNVNLPNYYGNVFVSSSLTPQDGVHGYIAKPDGVIELLGAGSSAMLLDEAPPFVNPLFEILSAGGGGQGLVFDASVTSGPAGWASGAVVLWDFGDGTTSAGTVVSHQFSHAGVYDVKLRVETADGTSSTIHAKVGVAGDLLLSFDGSDSDNFFAHGFGLETLLPHDASMISTPAGRAIDLGSTGTAMSISRHHVAELFGSDNFDLSFSLRSQGGSGNAGELFRLHSTMLGSIDTSGNLVFTLTLADGTSTSLKSTGVTMTDGLIHDIDITYGSSGLSIVVDGKVAAHSDISGSIGAMGSWDFVWGNPWGKQNFDGELHAFELSTQNGPYSVYSGTIDESTVPLEPEPIIEPAPAPAPESTTETETIPPSDPDGTWEEAETSPTPISYEDYTLDGYIASATELHRKMLIDDARAVETSDGWMFRLDGDGDYVNLGRLRDMEKSDQIAFSISFRQSTDDAGQAPLVWNDKRIGLSIEGDGIAFQIATADEGFKSFKIGNLGLDDNELHTAYVVVDAATDRLQIVVDNQLVIDESETDFAFINASPREWGWTLGKSGSDFFAGDVGTFRVDDVAQFFEIYGATADSDLVF